MRIQAIPNGLGPDLGPVPLVVSILDEDSGDSET